MNRVSFRRLLFFFLLVPYPALLFAGPESGEKSSITIAVYGDNREGWSDSTVHRQIVRKIREESPSLTIHTGDLVAKGGKKGLWEGFSRDVKPLLPSFYPVMGNHDESGENYLFTLLPTGIQKKSYYSFKKGPASFIALDTTRDFSPGSAQYRFLEITLAEWSGSSPIFVAMHHPPFSGGKHGGNKKVRKYLVPLFEKYGVDIVFSGHDHTYQRIGPVNGVLYIVTAGGGAPLVKVSAHPAIKAHKVLHHYVKVEVRGAMISGSMKNELGVVEDRFSIDHTANPIPPEKREALPNIPSSIWSLF